jgi:hypothetical protein
LYEYDEYEELKYKHSKINKMRLMELYEELSPEIKYAFEKVNDEYVS